MKPVEEMTLEECWAERAELAQGPGLKRRTPRYEALSARISKQFYETFPEVQKVKKHVWQRDAFFAGARAFMSSDPIARPSQEQALPDVYQAWATRERD